MALALGIAVPVCDKNQRFLARIRGLPIQPQDFSPEGATACNHGRERVSPWIANQPILFSPEGATGLHGYGH